MLTATKLKPGPTRGRGGVQIPPSDSAGRCNNSKCGTILYDDPAAVPNGWILIWHINVGGYCAECAVEKGICTAKAQAVLATYSPMASNGNKKTTVVV